MNLRDLANSPKSLHQELQDEKLKELEDYHELMILHAHSMYLNFMELAKKLPTDEFNACRMVADGWLNQLSDEDKIHIFDATH
jgi:hypothetical protein